MQAIRSRDTVPEIEVRRRLHREGLRYRVHFMPEPTLRRRADVVFTRAKVSIFIDGCFWHGCPEHGRKAFRHHEEYWSEKIGGNVERDRDTTLKLELAGWTVLRFWEHETPDHIMQEVLRALGR